MEFVLATLLIQLLKCSALNLLSHLFLLPFSFPPQSSHCFHSQVGMLDLAVGMGEDRQLVFLLAQATDTRGAKASVDAGPIAHSQLDIDVKKRELREDVSLELG